MPYWSSRWRRGIVTKNWHWHAAMLARFGNWFIGRGFKTDAEYWRDQDKAIKQGSSQVVAASQHNTPQDRPKLRNGNSTSVRNVEHQISSSPHTALSGIYN